MVEVLVLTVDALQPAVAFTVRVDAVSQFSANLPEGRGLPVRLKPKFDLSQRSNAKRIYIEEYFDGNGSFEMCLIIQNKRWLNTWYIEKICIMVNHVFFEYIFNVYFFKPCLHQSLG